MIFQENSFENLMEIREYFKRMNYPYQLTKNFGLSEDEIEMLYPTIEPRKPEIFKLKDFAIGIDARGRIVCLPAPKECLSYAIYGIKGSGKSLLSWRLVDAAYSHWNFNVGLLNDYLIESPSHANPTRGEFEKKLKWTTLENSRPLPIVPLIPGKISFIMSKVPKRMLSLKIKIPLDEFIKHVHLFYELDKSYNYFRSLDFSWCKSEDDIYKEIQNMENRIVEKGLQELKQADTVKGKLITLFKTFFNDGVISFDKNSFGKVTLIRKPHNIKFRDPKDYYDIFPLLYRLGVIPSLITANILGEKWFPSFVQFHIDKIIEYQQNHPKFITQKIWLDIEELSAISSVKNPTQAIESLKKITKQGRMMRIALCYKAQNVSDIDQRIRSQCKYNFIFRLEGANDRDLIKKDYGLSPAEAREISNLERFEFYGITKEEDFIVYDPTRGVVSKEKKIKAILIPPLSHHMPSDDSGKLIETRMSETDSTLYARRKLSKDGSRLYGEDGNALIHDIIFLDDKEDSSEVNFPKESAKIMQGIDLEYMYYGKKEKNEIIDYEKLKSMKYIVVWRRYQFKIIKKDDILENDVPYENRPKYIKCILHDYGAGAMRLFGKKCSDEWIEIK